MGTRTPNYNLYKPAEGESGWAADMNQNIDDLDTNLKSAADEAAAANAALGNLTEMWSPHTPDTQYYYGEGSTEFGLWNQPIAFEGDPWTPFGTPGMMNGCGPGLYLSKWPATTSPLAGIWQPTTPTYTNYFSFSAKILNGGIPIGTQEAGIFLSEGNDNGKFVTLSNTLSPTGFRFQAYDWTDASTHGAQVIDDDLGFYREASWLRMMVNTSGAKVGLFYSLDGWSWVRRAEFNLNFTHARMGLFVRNTDISFYDQAAFFAFFRISFSYDARDPIRGLRAQVVPGHSYQGIME